MARTDIPLGGELSAALRDILETRGLEAGLREALEVCASVAEDACSGRELDCGPGCPHCCVLNVSVLLPEAMRIAEQLVAEERWSALRPRLAEHRAWVRWMDDGERIMRRAYCPLLDDKGFCTVHPVRPLACRGVASLDRERCGSAFDPIIDDSDRSVPADVLRREVYDRAFVAMAKALAGLGLDDRSIELGAGILAFADMAELRARFMAGERLPRQIWE